MTQDKRDPKRLAREREARRRWWNKNRDAMNALQRERRREPAVKAQRAEWARLDKIAHPNRYRDKSYRTKYGITLADYDAMFAIQGGACAICREPCKGTPEKPYHRLHVDHNHETGKVRGLLCRRCNVAVGYLEHMERGRMAAATAYLQRHNNTLTENVL